MEQFIFLFPVLIFFLQHHFSYSSLSLFSHTDPDNNNNNNSWQKLALFQFKQSLGIDSSASTDCGISNSHPKTMNWSMSYDHCTWDGVMCNDSTGYIIGIDLSCSQLVGPILPNSTLFQLSHLQTLDLSFNDFSLSHQIPREFGRFAGNLMHLNLSACGFSSKIPSEIVHLHKLVSLDLSSDFGSFFRVSLEHELFKFLLQNLTQLRELSLDGVDISSVVPTNLSTSLRILRLGGTDLHGELSEECFHLPNLEILRLSYNTNLNIKLPKVKWGSSSTLTRLNLGGTNIYGEIPNSIGYLRSINILDLWGCNMSGLIPNVFANLKNLRELYLGDNNLNGPFPSSIVGLRELTFLHLAHNSLSGPLPSNVTGLQKLNTLFLDNNLLNGTMPSWLVSLPSLEYLYVSSNMLCGPVPQSASGLVKLRILRLSDNLLNGTIPSWLFSLQSIEVLDLSSNMLYGPIQQSALALVNLRELWLSDNLLNGMMPSWLFSLPSLESLFLDSNRLTGQLDEYQYSTSLTTIHCKNNTLFGFIPRSVLELVNLTSLDLSSNNLSGVLEIDMFSCLKNLESLDLSNNQIHGQIPRLVGPTWGYSLLYVDLSHNLLTGGIEQLQWNNLIYLNLMSNMLNGSLSWSICNSSSLEVLNLSNNNFSGVLPRCPSYLNYSLSVLDLRMNNFHGKIPSTMPNFHKLRTLNLHANQIEGTIPRSFANFKYLEVLDLGSNYMNGTFPNWLETLPNLQVLVLRSNRFSGVICNNPNTEHPFISLRIIDLSHNEFLGLLPELYFKNFQAMMNVDVNRMKLEYMGSDRYSDSVTIVIKGVEIEYKRILTVFTTIDLSSNSFEGKIPRCIGNLNSLLFLNLSRNGLIGHILSELGDLSNLESLDISFNRLEGEIPQQLTNLGFLAHLNVSQNHLSGPIPLGKQFNTFENNSYGGNLALCGSPLSKECEKNKTGVEFDEEDDSDFINGFSWKAVLMGYGCGIGLGFIIGNIMFLKGKPKWFTEIVDRELCRWKGRRRIEIRC